MKAETRLLEIRRGKKNLQKEKNPTLVWTSKVKKYSSATLSNLDLHFGQICFCGVVCSINLTSMCGDSTGKNAQWSNGTVWSSMDPNWIMWQNCKYFFPLLVRNKCVWVSLFFLLLLTTWSLLLFTGRYISPGDASAILRYASNWIYRHLVSRSQVMLWFM